jgi:hypothetical protein
MAKASQATAREYGGPSSGNTNSDPTTQLHSTEGEDCMTPERLSALIRHPDIQRKILGGYQGGYAIGVARHPRYPSQLAISVSIEGKPTTNILTEITLEEHVIPIIIDTDFHVPTPY